MKGFGSGFNNFFVGLFSGLLLPLVIIMVLIFLTVDKVTSFAENEAITPIYARGAETLDKLDTLIETIDTKVDDASLKDLQLLAPLKEANLFPELQQMSATIVKVRQVSDEQKQEMLGQLKEQLNQSLLQKFPPEKAQQLTDNLLGIADVLASKKEVLADKKQELVDKVQQAKTNAQQD
ncbi:hypothetical protein [Vibrio aphrogenes]|uniref:hypothetical protein n=1 Tax=Vibrio aphrogenes TaxID=1891186 RepID=UPI000B353E67|nr:hypothetical protein [Vibrio aphrogenes]